MLMSVSQISSGGPNLLSNPLVNSVWPVKCLLNSRLQTAFQVTAKHLPAALQLCADHCMSKTKLDFITYKLNQKVYQNSVWPCCEVHSQWAPFWQVTGCKGKGVTSEERETKETHVGAWLVTSVNIWICAPGPYLSQMLHLPVGELMKLYIVLPHICLYSSSLFAISP